jgi:hypothetical protein
MEGHFKKHLAAAREDEENREDFYFGGRFGGAISKHLAVITVGWIWGENILPILHLTVR